MKDKTLNINQATAQQIKLAAINRKAISGLTHNYYRYPARFSPVIAKEIICAFSQPGDYVLDPFVGGGTTLVEARALGRRGVGIDINSLAAFVTKTKTNVLAPKDIKEILNWSKSIHSKLNLAKKVSLDEEWATYSKNINCKATWPVRNTIQLGINYTKDLSSQKQSDFARCALLNSSQWALDSRRNIPTVFTLRERFKIDIESMLDAAQSYRKVVIDADKQWANDGLAKLRIVNRSAVELEMQKSITSLPAPKLILTSPPYPGVHVLYHRWQVHGRRETPAPYWISNTLDGSGESYYTFGNRHEEGLASYFTNTYRSFSSLCKIADLNTTIVQMVAFSEPGWQLPLYLQTLEDAGLIELRSPNLANAADGRLWRQVPNRKWHATSKGLTPSSKEVVLFHKIKG